MERTGTHTPGGRRSGKKRQMLQKHPASKSSTVSQAWATRGGANPSPQGLTIQQVVQFRESPLEKENPDHGNSPLPDIFHLRKLSWVFQNPSSSLEGINI